MLYSGEVPEEFFIPYPYGLPYQISTEYVTKGDTLWVKVNSGLADVFELEVFEDTMILFTDLSSDKNILFSFDLPKGSYRLLKSCMPYVQIYIKKNTNHVGRRWIARDRLIEFLYDLCIKQVINGIIFYYYDGSVHLLPSTRVIDFDENKTDLERLYAMNFIKIYTYSIGLIPR